MRRYFLAALAAWLAAASTLPVRPAAAFEGEHTELQRRMAQLENMVEEMKQQQAVRAAYFQPAPGMQNALPPSGEEMYSYPVVPAPAPGYPIESGFIAHFEFGFLKPYAVNGDAPSFYSARFGSLVPNAATAAVLSGAITAVGPDRGVDMGYQFAPRVTVGYRIPGGMGLRARYFSFDHTGTMFEPTSTASVTGRLRLQTIDLETFGTLRRGRNSGTMFGGVRYADHTATSRVTDTAGTFDGAVTQNAGGTGLTAGVTGSSIIGSSGNFSVNSGLRGSVLFGDAQYQILNAAGFAPLVFEGPISGFSRISRENNMFSIWEVTLGSQYKRQMRNGVLLVIGSSIEAQLWDGAGTLNPWSHFQDVGFNNERRDNSLGSFAMLGFWNSFGLSY